MVKLNIDLPGLKTTGYAYGEWTTTPPTEPGWYWAVYADDPLPPPPVQVFVDKPCHWNTGSQRKLMAAGIRWGFDKPIPLSEFSRWLGPLPEPAPPVDTGV